MNWSQDWHRVAIALMGLDHLWRRIADWEEDFVKAKAFFGRRKGDKIMGIIQEAELLVSLIPKIEKIVADAKVAEQTPQIQTLIADLEAILGDFKTIVQS